MVFEHSHVGDAAVAFNMKYRRWRAGTVGENRVNLVEGGREGGCEGGDGGWGERGVHLLNKALVSMDSFRRLTIRGRRVKDGQGTQV